MATITDKSSVHHCAGHVETTLQQTYRSLVRWLDRLKNDDIHQKYDVFRKYLKPLNTCKKHFGMILLNLPLDECKIQGKCTVV